MYHQIQDDKHKNTKLKVGQMVQILCQTSKRRNHEKEVDINGLGSNLAVLA